MLQVEQCDKYADDTQQPQRPHGTLGLRAQHNHDPSLQPFAGPIYDCTLLPLPDSIEAGATGTGNCLTNLNCPIGQPQVRMRTVVSHALLDRFETCGIVAL